MSVAELVIGSEDDAWELLRDACRGHLPEQFKIDFDNWPVLHIKLSGDQFNSTLTTRMMEAFIELQKNINLTYAKLYYNQATSRVLSDEDKEKIQIFVQVSPGSSDYKVDLQAICENLVGGIVSKMTGTQGVILLVAAGLILAGNSTFKSYLETQKEIKGLEMKQLAGEEETKRMKILADAMKHEPHIASVKTDAEEYYNKVLKASRDAKSVKLAGVSLEGEEATKLVRRSRSTSTEVRLDGIYRVIKIDNSKSDHFEVKLNDGKELLFTAKLDQTVLITRDQNRKLLEEALWTRKPVRLMVQGTKVRDQITQATILDVMDKYDDQIK